MNENPTIYFILTEVSVDDFRSVSLKVHKRFPDSLLVLTGGETHIHSSFFRIIDLASSIFKTVVVTTNGSMPDEFIDELLPFLRKNVYIQLSLDGPEDVHDALRGRGAFKNCVHCLDSLRVVSDHLIVSSTITFSTIDSYYALAEELNQYSFRYLKISPEQVGNPSVDKLIMPEVWNSFVDRVLPLCRFHVRIKKLFDFGIMDKYLARNVDPYNDHFTFNCGFGKAKFYITPTLDVLPCSCLSDVIGNLKTDSMDCIIDRLNCIGRIIPDINSLCHSCKYSCICNGGCPGYSKKVFGDYNRGDLRCPLLRDSYEKYQSIDNGQL